MSLSYGLGRIYVGQATRIIFAANKYLLCVANNLSL